MSADPTAVEARNVVFTLEIRDNSRPPLAHRTTVAMTPEAMTYPDAVKFALDELTTTAMNAWPDLATGS